MLGFLQRQNSVIAKPRRSTPDDDVPVAHWNPPGLVGSIHSTEEKYRGNAEGYRNDWRSKIPLVLVLMQRKLRSRLIAVHQTGIGLEPGKTRFCGRVLRELQKRRRHRGPWFSALRVNGIVPVASPVRDPTQGAAVCHFHRHTEATRRHH